jgi:hypothetical protein
MNIIKTTSGNVLLTDASGNVSKVLINVNALDLKGNNEIIVKYGFNQWTGIIVDKVQNTQVEPAAAIPFSGDANDLITLLSSDFFFELSGGGGDDLATVLIAGNSAGANDINLNNNDLLNTDKIDFNLATIDTAGEGQLVWSDTLGTLNLGLKGGNTISNLGQHIHARVVNKTTPLVNLTKAGYEVVIVAGATGQRLSVKLAKADNDANSAGTLGVVCENIAGNQEGFICSVGQVTNINTTGSLQGETWADGDSLYLSGTTFGAITNVKPSAPIHEVRIGYVEYAHAVNGKIYVKIDNGYELDELHNVSIASESNNDALVYESATALWKNKTIGGWNYIVKSANQDVTNSTVLVDDTDMQFSVVAGGQYMIEMDVVISANSTANDYKFVLAVSAGTMKAQGILTSNGAGGIATIANVTATAAAATTAVVVGTTSADLDFLHSMKIIYSFTASANATFKYQFAQNAGGVATTARTFKGSILKYKKIN